MNKGNLKLLKELIEMDERLEILLRLENELVEKGMDPSYIDEVHDTIVGPMITEREWDAVQEYNLLGIEI